MMFKAIFLSALGLMFSVNLFADAMSDAQLSCLLVPSQEIEISSPVAGVVNKVYVERGDKVRKGQRLLSLESAVQKAVYETAKAQSEFSVRIVERNQNLIDKNLLSDHEIDEISTERQLSELKMNEAEALMMQRTVFSPISGFVVERSVSAGEYVGPEPFAKLVALDPLHVEIVMPSDRRMLNSGMDVAIQPQGSETKYLGRIDIVDRVIDAASGTFGVRVVLPNPDYLLPAGLKCRAIFEPETDAQIETETEPKSESESESEKQL